MCIVFISRDGALNTPVHIRVPKKNFLATALRDEDSAKSAGFVEGSLSFRLDYGADVTCLSAFEAKRLKIDTSCLEISREMTGIGGESPAFKLEDVELGLVDSIKNGVIQWHIEKMDCIYVLEMGMVLPNLLGIDILRRFNIKTDMKRYFGTLTRVKP